MSDLAGRTIAGYEFHHLIGEGASGTVYRGLNTRTGELVAIKCLKPHDVTRLSGYLERFRREGELLRQMDHPNIVKLLDTVEHNGQQFLIMEYVPGGSLRDLLDQQPQLPLETVLWIALDLADALTRAHRLDIVHRDLKPENVLLADDGTPRLTDFGIAYLATSAPLTQEGALIGTPHYISPEALNQQGLDGRADIWSFGVMLFEMLAGRHPFEAELLTALLNAIMHTPPPDMEALRPDAPVALVDLIYRMLQKDPCARIPSVRLVGAELEALLRTEDVVVRIPGHDVARHTVDGSSVFATPTPVEGAPLHNLPVQTTPFVGRETELAEIGQLIADPKARLITILGPGGMGKTRLALEAAEAQVGAFERGVWFVPLAKLSDPAQIATAIADAVGFKFYQGGATQHEQLLNYLHAKSMLLVLDNFEHLLDGADLVHAILRTAPGIKVLATSRAKLNLGAEVLLPVGGIEFPDWETPEDALEYAAVKLFMQSARRVAPDFTLGANQLRYVARICRLVAGMPLGILLAAAWVDVLSPEEIATEIAHSLDFLASERRDLEERHRSIRAVFDSVWERLDDAERAPAMRMSIFRGGFTRDAAQHVAQANLRMLATLVAKSLLQRDPHTGRYAIHELLCQYLAEKLSADPAAEQRTVAAYCTYYADYFFERETDIQSGSTHEILVEMDNLHHTWHMALEHGDLANLRKFRILGQVYDNQGRRQHGLEVYVHATAVVRRLDVDGEQSVVLGNLLMWHAWFAGVSGKEDDSRALYLESLETLRSTGDNWEHALARMVAAGSGVTTDGDEARRVLKTSLDFFREIGDQHAAASCLFWMALLAEFEMKIDEARRYGQETVTLSRAIGGAYWELVGMWVLGRLAMRQHQFEEARSHFTIVLRDARAINAPQAISDSLNHLVYACLGLRDFEAAEQYVLEALSIAEDVGEPFAVLGWRDTSADVHYARGAYEEAQVVFEYVLDQVRGHDFGWVVDLQTRLALCAVALNDFEQARAYLAQALPAIRPHWLGAAANALIGCAAVLVYSGTHERAVELIALTERYHFALHFAQEEARLKADLQAQLPPDVFAAAWARGAALDLDTTVQELIVELASENDQA